MDSGHSKRLSNYFAYAIFAPFLQKKIAGDGTN